MASRTAAVLISVFLIGALCVPTHARDPKPNPWVEALPAKIDTKRRHLFYLHGHIIEKTQQRRPRHPSYGVYDYDQVLAALTADGALVISEVRPRGTQPTAYARKVAGQIQRLLEAGVPAERIGVVGFSRGGWIAQLISAQLEHPIRYVMLAFCPSPDQPRRPLHGAVLSIRERSDHTAGSCEPLFRASTAAKTRALTIDIGGRHGAFYRPHAAWTKPLLQFLSAP
ncbi:MAG: alpha/beta hydrolase [Myxococcales bacterium]|nr:alpha/beta hydrolase [Myxococcales bacterium]